MAAVSVFVGGPAAAPEFEHGADSPGRRGPPLTGGAPWDAVHMLRGARAAKRIKGLAHGLDPRGPTHTVRISILVLRFGPDPRAGTGLR